MRLARPLDTRQRLGLRYACWVGIEEAEITVEEQTWQRAALGLLVTVLALAVTTWGHGRAQQAEASDPARPDFIMDVAGVPGCTTDIEPPPTAKADAKCILDPGSAFTVRTELKTIGAQLGGQYIARQYVIDWSGAIEGPTKADPADEITNTCATIPAEAESPSWQSRPNTAAASCSLMSGALTQTGAASRVEWQFNCVAMGQGMVRMVTGTGSVFPHRPQDNTHLVDGSNPVTGKDGTEVLTINCVSVGGIAELPDAAKPPLAASESSGPNVGLLAALVGGALASAVALGAVGRYVWRRARTVSG